MRIIATIMRRLNLNATDAVIVAVVLLAVLNVLAEFWRWLGQS